MGEFELEEGSMKQPRIKENGENIIFMGKDPRQKPEYQPMTLQNRTLILGINKVSVLLIIQTACNSNTKARSDSMILFLQILFNKILS